MRRGGWKWNGGKVLNRRHILDLIFYLDGWDFEVFRSTVWEFSSWNPIIRKNQEIPWHFPLDYLQTFILFSLPTNLKLNIKITTIFFNFFILCFWIIHVIFNIVFFALLAFVIVNFTTNKMTWTLFILYSVRWIFSMIKM